MSAFGIQGVMSYVSIEGGSGHQRWADFFSCFPGSTGEVPPPCQLLDAPLWVAIEHCWLPPNSSLF